MKKQAFVAMSGFLLLAACAGPRPPAGEPYEPEVRQFIDDLANDFVADRRDAFFARFDAQLFPHYAGYVQEVRLRMIQRRLHMLDLVPDHVHRAADRAEVQARWRRSFTDAGGAQKDEAGTCTIKLTAAPGGAFLVTDIKGGSPF